MRLQAVIFDFDGLIVDTETPEFETWREEFQSHGVELRLEEWIKCVGAGPSAWDVFDHLESLLGQSVDRKDVARSRNARFADRLPQIQPREGVPALIDELIHHQVAVAIASSSTQTWVNDHLTRVGLDDRFAHIWTRDLVANPKPAPDLYLAACRSLSVQPENAVALEDSPNGILAAKAAGLTVVAAPNPITESFDLSSANLRLTSLTELSVRRLSDLLQS